jgi:hypothetical protein
MPIPRKEKHVRQMLNPQLTTTYERKSQKSHVLFRPKNVASTSEFSVASFLEQSSKTTETGKEDSYLIRMTRRQIYKQSLLNRPLSAGVSFEESCCLLFEKW